MYLKMKCLNEEIEFYRLLLDLTVELYGSNSNTTLKISKKLDNLIDMYYGVSNNKLA
jgi:hypothetical protein